MTSGMMNFLAFSWMVLIGLLQAGWESVGPWLWEAPRVDLAAGSGPPRRVIQTVKEALETHGVFTVEGWAGAANCKKLGKPGMVF